MSWRDVVENRKEKNASGWRSIVNVEDSKNSEYDEINNYISIMSKAKLNTQPKVTTTSKAGTVKYSQEGYDKKIKELESQQKALETKLGASAFQNITDKKTYNELTDIKAQISKLQNEKYLSDNYSDITKNTDFKELSLPKTRSAWETDSRYKAVNNIGNWQDLLEQSDTHSEEENYKYMTDEERGIFNYLYNTQGEKTANDYLDRLEYELNDRGMEQLVLDYQEYAREHPIAGTFGSTFTNIFGGAVGTADVIGQNIANVGRRIMGEETVPIDYNTPAQQGTVMTNTIRSTIAGDLNNNYGTLNENIPIVGGLGLGDLYQIGTSMIDSTALALIGKLAGPAGKASSIAIAPSALLGSSAASSAIQDASKRGLSDKQILLTGISAGATEMLFEKLSIENLIKPKDGATIGQAVKNTLKQIGIEASEEWFTSIANKIVDGIINGNKSEYNQAVDIYIKSGMTQEEAEKQAAIDMANSTILDALGGAISGATLGGTFEAGTRLSYNSAGKRILNDSSALDSLRAAANESGVSLSENPTYKEAGRALRSIDFNRATGNISDNTATETTGAIQQSDDLQQAKAKQEQSSKAMLRATYSTEDGRYIDSDITGIKNGEIQFSDNTTHNLSDVYINDSEMASVVRYALENEKIGNTIITAYNSGVIDGVSQNATDFIAQFENAIEYGKVGAKLDYVKNSEAVNTLTPTQIEMAYYIGSGQSTSAVSENSVKAENKTQELKVDSQKQSQANRLSKAVGRDIVFYESQNTSENGFYNPKDGKIYINTNSKNPLPQIVSHELTHSIELSRSYGELSRIIFNKLKKSGSDIEQMRQQKKELYSRNGIELQDETAIDQEIVAEYIEKNLLTDEKSIYEFVKENRSLGEKIFDWINSVLAKLGNKKAQEREFLTRVRDLYSKALKDVEMDRNTKIEEYYINPDFESKFDEWMKLSESERAASKGRFLIVTTSDALKSIGVKNYRIYWDKGALAAKMRKHEELTPDIIKQLPNIIENPVLVLKSETVENSITVWGEVYDRKTNNPIMVAIKLNAKTKTGVVSNFAVITSAYKRPISQLQNFLNKAENILYLDDNKKRTNDWLQSLGLQLPPLVHQYGSIHTISQQDDSVKGYSLNNLKFPLKETEVDSRKNVKYNIDSIGGEENGRSGEVRNYRNGYEEKENTSRQIGLGTETGRKTGRNGKESRASGRRSSNVYSKDSEGRRISTETANRLNGTAIVDDNGNPIAVYHSTPNMDFTEFAVGDIGFHFGNENQAENRLKGKGTKGRFIKSYLNIKNPIEFKYDLPDWNASAVAIHLWNDGIISFDEYLQVHKLYLEDKDNYNSKSSTELRKILAEKDYDGIVYENEIEGEGKSYIAFYPEQVVIFDDGKGKKTQFSISETYKKEIDEWDGKSKKTFYVGTTSEVLKSIGVKDRGIIWHSGKITKIFEKHPEMNKSIIKQVPEILEDPIVILKSKQTDSRILIFGELYDTSGAPVTAILELKPTTRGGELIDINIIASAYGKSNNPAGFIKNSELLYLNENKNRTKKWLQSVGLQLPSDITTLGPIGNVTYDDGNVNITGVPFSYILGNSEIQFSISESYSDEIDEWNSNGRKDNEKFILGTTSDIIQGLGARENDIYIKSEKINTIFEEHPEMTIEEIKKIPEILEYPVMILKSKNKNRGQKNNTRIVVLGKVTAKNGLPVIGVLDLRPFENGSVVDDMQKINSTYTKKNTLNFLEDSEVLYADKKRTASLLKSVGLQLRPTELQRVGSIGSISYNKRSVNIVGVPFNDLFIRDSESQYSVSDDEIRNLNTQEEKLTTELSEMEQQYLVAQIEQGKKDAKVLRSEKDKLRKQIESLEKRSTRKAKTQLKQYQRNLDKMADRIAYKDEQLKALKQNKNDAVLAARIAEGRVWSEKYGKDISELQEKISRKNVELQEVRKKRDQMLAEKTESFKRYKGERRKTVLRGQIKSLVNDFNARLDRPNQKRYIPKELVNAVIDLTSVINISNDSNSPKIQAQMEHMKAVYDRYKNDPEYTVYDDFVSQMIGQVTKEIGNTPLRDMTENQLRMVYDTLTAFSRAVTDAQRFAALQYDKSIYQAGTDAINEIRSSKLKFKGDGINNFVNWLLTPERFFNRLGGYRKNGIWEKVGKSLNESTQKAIGISREFYYTFREFSESNYADELADQKKLYDVGLKTEDGNPIKITKGQMISIYMHLTSADNRRAIQYGGLSIPDMDAYYKGKAKNAFGKNKIRTVGLSQEMRTLRADYVSAQEELQALLTKYTEDGEIKYNSINEIDMQMIEQYQKNIEAIEAQMETASKNSDNYIAGIEENINKILNDEDKKFIKTLRSWYKYSADKINEVTMRMYGIKRATVDNYYTIHRDPDLLAKEFSDIVMDFSLESWGSLKERVPSVQPILLTDVMFDVSSHANELSQYYGYVEMMRDFNKLYNTRSGNTSVKESVSQKLGAGSTKIAGVTGEQYIANLMADIVGSRTRQNSLLSILRRNVTRSALTVNIRVGFSQLSGTLSAPAEVGWSATLKGMGKGAVKALSPKYKEHLAAINEFYYERYKGEGGMREFSDIKVADNALDRIWNKIDDKTKGYLLNWSRSVDAYSTAVMYSMAEAYVQDTLQIKPGDAAYLDEVNKKFTNILIHTQPQGAATQRADLFRDPREGYSFVTLFKSQSNQFFNLLYDASARVWTYQNAIKNGDSTVTQEDLYMAKRDLANAATTVILGGSLGYAVTRFIANAILRHMDDYRDEDDEVTAQSIALGIANDSISSFAGILPLGEEIYDLIMASITDRPYYGISEAGLQSLNDTFNGIVSFSGDVKDNEVTLESFTKLIKAAAPMLMIPYNSINTIIEAAKGYINDIPSGNFLTFEYGAERNNTTQGKRMYEAIIEGDTEKYNSVRDEMIEDNIAKGKSRDDAESAVRSALKSTLKDKFLEGEITSSDANEILVSHIYNGEETAVDDAYWTLQEWQSGNPEYSKYGDLKEAVIKADGTEFKQAKAELIEHGVKESSIRSEITKAVKDAYLNGELSLNEAKNKLILYNGLSASEAFDKIKEWKKEAK